MAVNFCCEQLAKISCDQVCDDHHDVQNLISTDENVRRKGFLVEYFIRPPVTIKIEFILHNLDLMYIELGLQVRQNRSKGIEVYTQTNTNQSQLIAKCFNTPEKIFIVNNCYRPSRHLPHVNSTFNDAFSISGRNLKYCNNVKCIFIKIFSTLNSTIPCLSHLNIYGKSNGIVNNQFYELLNANKIENQLPPPRDLSQDRTISRKLSQQIEHLAPPEFIDALTSDLMKMPYLLPSGKNIDQTTLNKYLATTDESNVSDPFTRIPFTEEHKPTLNVELKSRIDLFYSTNGQSEIDRRNELRRKLLNLPTSL